MEREFLYYRGAAIALCHFDFAKSLEFLQKSLIEEHESSWIMSLKILKFNRFRDQVKILT